MTDLDGTDQVGWYSDDAATFGDRVAGAREALSMNQEELARRLGVKLKTIHGWENDLTEPRANKLQMLAGVLNVSMVWLMAGEGRGVSPENFAEPTDRRDLLLELRSLRQEALRFAERIGRLEKQLAARSE